MNFARRQPKAVRLALLVGVITVTIAPPAQAGTTDVTWALGQSTVTYGGDTQFHVSSGGALVQYRWIDALTKDTVISANSCSDLSLYGSTVINSGDMSYHTLYNGPSGGCFVLRGRVASGQGSTTSRTGRVSR